MCSVVRQDSLNVLNTFHITIIDLALELPSLEYRREISDIGYKYVYKIMHAAVADPDRVQLVRSNPPLKKLLNVI